MTTAASGDTGDCIFCSALTNNTELILFSGKHVFIILNKFPYNNGHLMLVPKRHISTLEQLNDEELSELGALIRTTEIVINEAYKPNGINVGINLGRSAGAGLPDHIHVHVVPRWDGDTNFMTVVGETRVVPEEPNQTIERLRPIFSRILEN